MSAKSRTTKMAARPKRTAGGDYLPPEIWREVLARVPAKSILRCRSVCKSWYTLVSCPNFISYHSTKTLNKNRLLQLCDSRFEVYSFSSLNESFMESCEHYDLCEVRHLQIVGSCDGLICLSKYPMNSFSRITFFVWNPTIKKVVELPSLSNGRSASFIGFGFDSKTSDYKVLCTIGDVCRIFDLSKGVWRSISPMLPPRVDPIRPQCYLDGAVHWSTKKHPNCDDMILLSFNMSDECFQDVKMPDLTMVTTPGEFSKTSTRCVALGGLIYVIACDRMMSCSVWVLKEYGVAESWTKVSHINMFGTRIWPYTSSYGKTVN